MKTIYLVNYAVKGIKTLDEEISLSFYKKTIEKNPDTRDYNVKGIYGMNGSGKSAIIASVDILRSILIDPGYLNNPIAQENLDAIINKKLGMLYIQAEYMMKSKCDPVLFRYGVQLSKNSAGKYVISREQLSFRRAISRNEAMIETFNISDGEIMSAYRDDKHEKENEFYKEFCNKTMNLLSITSASALYYEKFLLTSKREYMGAFQVGIEGLFWFGMQLHVYIDQSDDHREYVVYNSLKPYMDKEGYDDRVNSMLNNLMHMDKDYLNVLAVRGNVIPKKSYEQYESTVSKLYEFLHIFKSDLQGIEIDRKENKDAWVCNLVMVYDGYKINAEYESTGIKKLVRLFAYIKEMVHGGIVFIDELDSNLHDVYLCALLEYLMEYGQGQLCFTTHNVGPMDVLRQHRKSIDFLSENHKLYPWTTNGNYSPSKLYRKGMIEGSPFNVDSTDFISIFGAGTEDE